MDEKQATHVGKRQLLRRRGEPTIPPHRRIKTLASLHSHLQTAIELEQSTIPPYLCALYSIKDGSNREAAQIIKSVVLEEMLHMILAANVLNAVGGEPSLNHPKFIPEYPTFLPHSDDAFRVNLEKFSKQALETFLRIERPAKPHAPPEADKYHTIAQFYEAIELGLHDLSAEGSFTGDISRQITPEYYYGGGGEAIPVTDLPSALQALDEITGQGEGVHHTIFDGDQEQFGEVKELAHYFRFNEIYQERRYTAADTPTSGPSGARLLVHWDQVYPMRPNPKMAHYPHDSALWRKAYAFNRTYRALLDELHAALNGKPKRLMQSVVGMYDLKYQAVELMKIPVGDEEMTAGPSFEYVSNSIA
ncbi:MAG TPA: ferritin-like protein [Anaerolineae bacterium]|nr:ferritin-like protein [Anaerolineae bacterium]